MAFQGFLKQSTAVDVLVGPFVDESDGKTAETGLTIAQADVRLSKNGQNMAQKSDNTSCAHDEIGMYNCELDATDTNTVGQLTISIHESGALPVRLDYHIVEEAVYDAMYGASAAGPNTTTPPTAAAIVNEWESQSQADPTGFHVNVKEVNGTGQTANDNGADINLILADTNELQTDDIPGSLSTISGKIDTIDDFLDTEVAAILADTNELQTDWTNGGRLDLLLDATLADTAELQGDWANGGRLDLLLDATLADTNELQGDWTNGGRLDLIVDSILVDTAVIGSAGAGLSAVTTQVLTTQMTESYAANGTAPTLAQAIFAIHQKLMTFAYSGTASTTYKLDNSTTAFSGTLDDASSPTSDRRAP